MAVCFMEECSSTFLLPQLYSSQPGGKRTKRKRTRTPWARRGLVVQCHLTEAIQHDRNRTHV